jgi:hypothetical protein
VQITALNRIVIAGGPAGVEAGGAGGQPGVGKDGSGGAGGGSGGAILLEAPVVTLTGAVVAANGGSGGQGNGFENGVAGGPSAMRAEGAGEGDGRGGDGGARNGVPEAGFGSLLVGFDGSGGGGGGAGRIRVVSEELQSTGGTVISPAETVAAPVIR